nr:hypothetical protein [Tanacetum cinerariifolium]
MSFTKSPGKNTPQCYTKPLDSLKNWNNRFFWVDECVFPTAVEWRTNASKDRMPASGTYSVEAVRVLDTHRTPIQKQPKALLCLVGISRRYYLGDDVYPTFYYDDDRGGNGSIQLNTCSQSNKDFLGQYNINLARQVAMGSQLCLRFEHEAKLLRKSVAQVARREQRIQARESEIKNLEALLETEADMKRAAKEKSAGLSQELERMRAQFSELQQDQMVERRCAEMDARLDAMSIDFDKELYPHMLTAIACRMWVIGHGLRLATMKFAESLEMRQAFADVVSAGIAKGMSEGLKHRVGHGHAQQTIESLEAYDPEAEAKFAATLQSLKDLKLPLLDQLEGLKDAPMDVIMASLYLEDDTRGMPHNLYATSIPVPLSSPSRYTHRSDRVPVSAPIVVPRGLALILVDAATQTDPDA